MHTVNTLEFSTKVPANGDTPASKITTTVDVNVAFDSLPDASKAKIIAYGMTQLFRDGAAIGADDVAAAFYGTRNEDGTEATPAGGAEAVAKLIRDGVAARVAKAKEGKLDDRSRGPTDPVEAAYRDVGLAALKAHFASKGQTVTAKDLRAAFETIEASTADGHVAAKAKWRKEAKRRVDAAQVGDLGL